MISAAQWARRGSEAQAEDAGAMARGGLVTSHSQEAIELSLREHFAADLDELSREEREEAVDALMRGYRYGA